MKITTTLFLSACLSWASYSQAHEFNGQAAKNLYLALGSLQEVSELLNGVKKESSRIECSHYFLGLRYNEHYLCTVVDANAESNILTFHDVNFHDNRPSIQGAERLMSALIGAEWHSDHGNPPAQSLAVEVSCLLKSSTLPPERSDAELFSCEVNNLEN